MAGPSSAARAPKNMVRVPGGVFVMGSEDFYPEERPVHDGEVGGFWMDQHPVTVAEFRRFVKATGHVTVAETAPGRRGVPGRGPRPAGARARSSSPRRRDPVRLDDYRAWWSWMPAAQWRHPEGPGSTSHGLELHPVTHVAYADARRVRRRGPARRSLPRPSGSSPPAAGLRARRTPGVRSSRQGGRMMANTWQGDFPVHNDLLDGYDRTSPVGQLPAQRLRPGRHHRQRLGVDVSGLHQQPRGRRDQRRHARDPAGPQLLRPAA